MKPFLLIQSRPEDETSDNEYQAFLTYAGLQPESLTRLRGERQSIGTIELGHYSGIIIGGGPFNMSDPDDQKSDDQRRFESEIMSLLDAVIENDFPMLAACYGIGVVVQHQGGVVSRKYGEPVSGVDIVLTEEGQADKLLNELSNPFRAFVGHKEACEVLPGAAVLLARSVACPVQMFRIKNNIYVTQFHPELDSQGLETRINAYRNHGYFKPEEAGKLIAMGYGEQITEPAKIIKNFVNLFQVAK